MQSTPEYVRGVNRTYRPTPPGGNKSVVPRVVAESALPGETILDFGAGKMALHARELSEKGLDVTAHDIGGNFDHRYHDPAALYQRYDLVYASNVLNVQPDEFRLDQVLDQVAAVLSPGGRFIANYPEPRKTGLSVPEMEEVLRQRFGSAERVRGVNSPVWICTNGVFKSARAHRRARCSRPC